MTEYQKLTSYFGERKRSGGAFVADALLELYGRHEIAASILLRGAEGFGLKHHLRTDRSLSLSEDLPLVAVAVDTRPRIEELLGPALALNRTGLVTVDGARLLDDTAVPGPDEETKLTVYLGRQERAYRVPAFVAVCDLLHRPRRSGTRASRCTAPSSSGCARPGSAAPPRCSASGASTATTPRTATGCCNWAGTCPP